MKRAATILIFVLGLLVWPAARPYAQNVLERLVMPGALIEGHAKAEADCANCHKSFSKDAQSELCAACHRDVAADMRGGIGFHGKSRDVRANACRHCHTDHKGRQADIVKLDRNAFDHGLTNFPLSRGHKDVGCESCHKPASKFRAAASRCVDCHGSADPHKGKLGTACEFCHSDTAWKETKTFDHAKTLFALTGVHEKTRCAACHAGERYKGTPVTCIACHADADVHRGVFGETCDRCHAATTWTGLSFDHDRDTKFPLAGKHKIACAACHKQDPGKAKTPSRCLDCHARDDVHELRLGKACQDCHNESGWKIGVLFDHGQTKLPLRDKHAVAKCADCHKQKIYDPVPIACVSCHARKDVHAGRLGPKCEACHNARDWKEWSFDHAKQTKYPLTGAHAKTGCYACHAAKDVKTAVLPTDCLSCHKKDDAHKGAFGKDCGRCHSTANFSTAIIPR